VAEVASELAFLEVRLFPWRLRPRVMEAKKLRDGTDPFSGIAAFDDLAGVVFGLALWIAVLIAAPLIVLVLAALLFSIELPLLIVIALLLVIARVIGVIPWVVGVVDQRTGLARYERTRSLFRAVRLVHEVNGEHGVPVRWHWW